MITYSLLSSNWFMNRDFSLIDANINRAREGLRVIEDVCRFIVRHRSIFERTKTLRHELIVWEQALGAASKLSGRIGEDVGFLPVVKSEYLRHSLWEILRANFNRVAEAARTLEEFSKIYFPAQAEKVEELRYKIYQLEFDLLTLTPHYWLNIYFEAGIVYPISDKIEELIWLINHGAKILQLRDKTSSKLEIYQKARHLCEFIRKFAEKNKENGQVLLLINDYPDIAAALPVAGVHVGQDYGPTIKARYIVGAGKIIGRTGNSLDQARQSAREGADYVTIGPVFATPTKADRRPVGLSAVENMARDIRIPWLAIGGINKDNVGAVYGAGAKNVALIRSAREFFL